MMSKYRRYLPTYTHLELEAVCGNFFQEQAGCTEPPNRTENCDAISEQAYGEVYIAMLITFTVTTRCSRARIFLRTNTELLEDISSHSQRHETTARNLRLVVCIRTDASFCNYTSVLVQRERVLLRTQFIFHP